MGVLPGLCINGKTHDLARIDVETELGTREVWKIVSRGMAHPFHVHGASFRLHALKGERKGYWAVTVRANWRIVFRFTDGKASEVDFVDYH
jgi:FtsP/CotA-like multicopper oxidase with cupredoxin domain